MPLLYILSISTSRLCWVELDYMETKKKDLSYLTVKFWSLNKFMPANYVDFNREQTYPWPLLWVKSWSTFFFFFPSRHFRSLVSTGFLPLQKLYSLLKLRFNFCVSVKEHKSRSWTEVQTAVLGTSSSTIIHGEKLVSQTASELPENWGESHKLSV